MADIESNRDFNEDRLRLSFSEADLQLVVGADDLKSIERDIHLFQQNSQKFQMIVTSPGPRLTGALRFGAGTCTGKIKDDITIMSHNGNFIFDSTYKERFLIKLFSGRP